MFASSLLLVGCESNKLDDNMFTKSYIKEDGTTIVYDTKGNNYVVSGDELLQTDEENLTQSPALVYSPIHWDYTMVENFQGNYDCSPTDAFAYITKLEEAGYVVTQTYASPDLAIIKVDGEIHYIFYIEKDTTRMYCVDDKGKATDPVIKTVSRDKL